MAWWSRTQSKPIEPAESKVIPIGAPVAVTPTLVGKPYSDGWDIARAHREGLAKVVWVYRAIDAIAGNQTKLPVILHKDNEPDGEIVRKHDTLKILNTRANIGESSSVFRYRLSSQLLMSTRGVFVEVVRGNNGHPVALHLLPPQATAPIPHPTKFVSGFEVKMPNGDPKRLSPENVIWIRRPHPLDPYLSMTPLQSAGIAIEVEALAKLYNRNFLLNDGRPGGLLVLRSEVSDADKQELQARFRGNINRAGMVGVVSADEGIDFVDTAATPRDAAYIEMRRITKEEILAAFGVPESIIGNASGRTFSNASEEGKVFWQETMMPHLDLIARGLDELEEEYMTEFDTSQVPILILAKHERHAFSLNEFSSGGISLNEYRAETGRKTVKSELADAMLVNPNLTPIGNTEKEMKPEDLSAAQGAPLDVQNGQVPQVSGQPQPGAAAEPPQAIPTPEAAKGIHTVGNLSPAVSQYLPASNPEPTSGPVPSLVAETVPYTESEIEVKRWDFGEGWGVKVEQDAERWGSVMGRTLERFFDRQQRVVLEKVSGKRAKQLLEDGKLEAGHIFDQEVWDRQVEEDLRPVIAGIMIDAAGDISEKTGSRVDLMDDEECQATLTAQVEGVKKINETTRGEIAAAILVAMGLQGNDETDALTMRGIVLKSALAAIFINAATKRREQIAEDQTLAAHGAGVYFAGQLSGAGKKKWNTRLDTKVRPAHKILHGKSLSMGEGFAVGRSLLRFPHDPLAPPELTIGCRCFLTFED